MIERVYDERIPVRSHFRRTGNKIIIREYDPDERHRRMVEWKMRNFLG